MAPPFLSCHIEGNSSNFGGKKVKHNIELYRYTSGASTPYIFVDGKERRLYEGEFGVVSSLLIKGKELISQDGNSHYLNNTLEILVKSRDSASVIFAGERYECLPN